MNNDELPIENTAAFQSLVSDGIMFLRSLTDFYGQDLALQAWEQINLVLGPEVKQAVLMELLMGGGSRGRVAMSPAQSGVTNRVLAVKAIRRMTGHGLKEALDLVKAVEDKSNGTVTFDITDMAEYKSGLADLRAAGVSAR